MDSAGDGIGSLGVADHNDLVELVLEELLQLVDGLGAECDNNGVAGDGLLFAGGEINSLNSLVGDLGYLVAAEKLYVCSGELLHHNYAGHELFLQNNVGQHFNDADLVTALKQFKAGFNADLTAAADDHVTLDLALLEQNILRDLDVFTVDTGDVENQRLGAGCKEDDIGLDGVNVCFGDGSVEMNLHIIHAAELGAEEFGNVIQNILAGGAGSHKELTAADLVGGLVNIDIVTALSGDVSSFQTGRAGTDDSDVLLYLCLADITVWEAALASGYRVESAAERHLAEYALADAVVAVEALADAVQIALLDFLDKIGIDDPLAGQRNEICLTGRQYFFCDLGVEYTTLSKNGYADNVFDGFCEVGESCLGLINGRDHPFNGFKYSGFAVESGDTVALHPLSHDLGLLDTAAGITEEFINGPAYYDREVLTALCLNVFNQLVEQAVAILKRSAVLILAVVEPGGEELGNEIAADRMDGHSIEAGSLCVPATPAKAIDHGVNLINSERSDRCTDEAGLKGAGSNTCLVINTLTALIIGETERLCTAAGADIDGAFCACAMDGLGELGHHGDVHVVVDTYGTGIRVDLVDLGGALSGVNSDETATASCAFYIVINDFVGDFAVRSCIESLGGAHYDSVLDGEIAYLARG